MIGLIEDIAKLALSSIISSVALELSKEKTVKLVVSIAIGATVVYLVINRITEGWNNGNRESK